MPVLQLMCLAGTISVIANRTTTSLLPILKHRMFKNKCSNHHIFSIVGSAKPEKYFHNCEFSFKKAVRPKLQTYRCSQSSVILI